MQIEQQDFYARLKTAFKTVDKDPAIDAFSHFCFRDGKLLTYNGTTGTILHFPNELGCCVEAEKFLKLVGKLKGELSLDVEEGFLHLTAEDFSARFRTLPKDQFPDIIPVDRSVLCEAEDLRDAFSVCADGMLKKGEDPQLWGVGIKKNAVWASDKKTITRADISSPCDVSVHVPPEMVLQVVALGNPAYLFRSQALVGAMYVVEGGYDMVVSRQVKEEFPFAALESALSPEPTHRVTVSEEIIPVMQKVQAYVANKDIDVFVDCNEGTSVVAQDDTGEVRQSVASDGRGKAFKVNAKRFLEALKKTKTFSMLGDVALLFEGDKWDKAVSLSG